MYFPCQQIQTSGQLIYKRWKQNLSETFRFVSRRTSRISRLSVLLGMFCVSAQPTYAEGRISLTQTNQVYINYLTVPLKIKQNKSFNVLLYVLIPDGYQHSIGTSGFKPLRFVLNHKKFKNTISSHSRDLSYNFVETNLGNSSASASFQNPSSTDTFMSFSNKVFLTRKDSLSGSLTRKTQGISIQTSIRRHKLGYS
jgi:hypothetical protein